MLLDRWLSRGWARRLASRVPEGFRERAAAALGRRPVEVRSAEQARRAVELRLREAAVAHDREFRTVRSREDWERFRDPRLAALRASLGAPSGRTTGPARVERVDRIGEAAVEVVVAEGRASLPMIGDLYRTDRARPPGPGVVVVPSHHTGRTHPELRDLGIAYATAGCVVLVPELSGHGERRLHPFDAAGDFPAPYPVERQDYYFRFNLGLQLELAGESLMGWLVEDARRAVDLLLARDDVDPERVAIVGSVAGGGDVAAVAAALDPRVRVVAAFGFGEQPAEIDRVDDAALAVPGAGRGSWESTRNLPCSARDGFLPWVVLAAAAPRPLVYAHEFAWDAAADPVWDRLRRVYALYGAADRLRAMHGRGSVRGRPPENTHCTHVGRVHRLALDPILAEHLRIPVPAAAGGAGPARVVATAPRPRHGRARALCERFEAARAARPALDADALRERLAARLGVGGTGGSADDAPTAEITLERPRGARRAVPVVVGVAQCGGAALTRLRRRAIRRLLRAGHAFATVDLPGFGPSSDVAIRGRHGRMTEVAASERMLGRTLLGRRLEALLSALRGLRDRDDVLADRIAVWGDSATTALGAGDAVEVPFDAGVDPRRGEPGGALLALLAALFDPRVGAVVARGALVGYRGALESAFCYLPADAVIPGIAGIGDVAEVVAALAPRPVLLDAPIDACNRAVPETALRETFLASVAAYERAGASGRLRLSTAAVPDREAAAFVASAAPSGRESRR